MLLRIKLSLTLHPFSGVVVAYNEKLLKTCNFSLSPNTERHRKVCGFCCFEIVHAFPSMQACDGCLLGNLMPVCSGQRWHTSPIRVESCSTILYWVRCRCHTRLDTWPEYPQTIRTECPFKKKKKRGLFAFCLIGYFKQTNGPVRAQKMCTVWLLIVLLQEANACHGSGFSRGSHPVSLNCNIFSAAPCN